MTTALDLGMEVGGPHKVPAVGFAHDLGQHRGEVWARGVHQVIEGDCVGTITIGGVCWMFSWKLREDGVYVLVLLDVA